MQTALAVAGLLVAALTLTQGMVLVGSVRRLREGIAKDQSILDGLPAGETADKLSGNVERRSGELVVCLECPLWYLRLVVGMAVAAVGVVGLWLVESSSGG